MLTLIKISLSHIYCLLEHLIIYNLQKCSIFSATVIHIATGKISKLYHLVILNPFLNNGIHHTMCLFLKQNKIVWENGHKTMHRSLNQN